MLRHLIYSSTVKGYKMFSSIFRGIGALVKSGVIFRLYSLLGFGIAILICLISNKKELFPGMLNNPIAYIMIFAIAPVLAYADRKSREYGKLVPKLLIGRAVVNFIGGVVFYIFTLLFFDFFWLLD